MTDLIRFPSSEQLKAFLYGELPENEAEAIEDLLFADSDVFDELTSMENDLIDRYVLRKLEGADLAAFEKSLGKFETRREKVKDATALQRYIKERKKAPAATVPETPRWSPWSRPQRIFGVQAWAVQFAMAVAILVLGAGVAWLLFHDFRLRQELVRMQTLQSEQEAGMQNSRREVAELQRKVNEQAEQLARQTQTPPEKPGEFAYTATIKQENTAGGSAPTVITPGKDSVTVELPLNIIGDFQSYRITDDHDQAIASKPRVRSRSGNTYLLVSLPVKSLTFKVWGINSDRSPRKIGDYHLEIRRQP